MTTNAAAQRGVPAEYVFKRLAPGWSHWQLYHGLDLLGVVTYEDARLAMRGKCHPADLVMATEGQQAGGDGQQVGAHE